MKMTNRERLLNTFLGKPVDRAPYLAPAAWATTIERWKREGYDGGDLRERFGCDRWDWCGAYFFPCPPFERVVLEETDEHVVYRNHEGIVMKEFRERSETSMPQFISFPAESREAFRAFCAERLRADTPQRLGADWQARCATWKDRVDPLWIISDRWGGFYGGPRAMMSVEKLSVAFYEQPDLVEEMMDYLAQFIIDVLDRILADTAIDVYGFWEDMAYKTASLLGPDMVRKYMLPRYKKVVRYVRSKGVPLVSLDSDGHIWELIPLWLEAGVDIIYPFEVAAGMDVVAARREFGRRLRMFGGIDKRAIAAGARAIEKEVDRVMPLVEEGGYIPAPDHSLPPDVSFANLCYYMEYLGQRLGV